jgi:hypothetical protein
MSGNNWVKGQPKMGGRQKGAKNRLSWAFISELASDFEKFGAETIRIARIEKPHEYLKIVAGLMPKEFEFTETTLTEVSDNDLDAVITYIRGRLAAKRELAADIGSREEPTTH